VVLEHRNDWESALAIKTYALEKIDQLREQGAPIRIAAGACEGVLSNALTTLCARKMLEQRDGLLRAAPDAEDVLTYYANSINRWCLSSAGTCRPPARGARRPGCSETA
jgi:hypothetical protein